MTSSQVFSISMCFFFFALFLSLLCRIPPADGTSEQDLSSICSSTQNDELCKKLLLSDPRTNSSEPPLLSIISIELTLNQTESNLRTFINYRDNSTDQSLRTSYDACAVKYRTIKDDLHKAYGLSKQGDYNGVIRAGPPVSLVYNCENALPNPSPTAAITEDMLLAIETFSGVASYVRAATSLGN